jgi:hypothetical protein
MKLLMMKRNKYQCTHFHEFTVLIMLDLSRYYTYNCNHSIHVWVLLNNILMQTYETFNDEKKCIKNRFVQFCQVEAVSDN